MQQIKNWLTQWGIWSRTKIGTEYKTKAIYLTGSGVVAEITDEQALMIDKAIASLKNYDKEGYKMLIAFYQYQQSCRAISRTIDKRPDYVTAYLGRAESYVAGRLGEGFVEH